MKLKYLLLLGALFLIVSGCSFDEAFEKETTEAQKDGDDINIIQEIGPQSLDSVIDLLQKKVK